MGFAIITVFIITVITKYYYNEDGLRTSKTKYEYGTKKFEETYIWSGDKPVAMKKKETSNGLTAVISYLCPTAENEPFRWLIFEYGSDSGVSYAV